MTKTGGSWKFKVSHFEYWWRPILNTFTPDGLMMRRFYRQIKKTYIAKDGKLIEYFLEVHQR